MRVFLITQDDPFYITRTIKDLIHELKKDGHQVIGSVASKPSPFGKKESFLRKAIKTFSIFGLYFFLRYTYLYLLNRFIRNLNLSRVLSDCSVPEIKLNDSINHENSLKKIRDLNPDILISVAGNEIFKKPLIDLAPKGCLNLHTALLPKYRGLMPTFWVLKNNEQFTGVSVFFVDEGIDSGDIVVQKKIEIADCSQEELINKTKSLGIGAICEALRLIEIGNVELIPNDIEKGSYFSFPTKEDVMDFKLNNKKFF